MSKQQGLAYFDAIILIASDTKDNDSCKLYDQLNDYHLDTSKMITITKKSQSALDCVKSHIQALNTAIDLELTNTLILDEEFVFNKTSSKVCSYVSTFFEEFKADWDVLFLSSNVQDYAHTHHDEYKRVLNSDLSYAYAVNSSYFLKLKTSLESALEVIDSKKQTTQELFKSMQPTDRWYIGKETIGDAFSIFSPCSKKPNSPNYYP